jgi:hypothetical protein
MNIKIDNRELSGAHAPRVLGSAPSPKQSFRRPSFFANESKTKGRDRACAPRKAAARLPFFI